MGALRTYPLAFERRLAKHISEAVNRNGKGHFLAFEDALGKLTEVSSVEEVLSGLPETGMLSEDDYGRIDRVITKAMLAGVEDRSIVDYTVDLVYRKTMHAAQADHVRSYADAFFRKTLGDTLKRKIRHHSGTGIVGTPEALSELRAILAEGRLSTAHTIVSNGAISRAFSYGVLRQGMADVQFSYQLFATMDDRTSDICRELNGKTYSVFDGLELLELVAKSPLEETPRIHKWVSSAEKLKGKLGNELAEGGIVLPPFHAHCRTVVKTF